MTMTIDIDSIRKRQAMDKNKEIIGFYDRSRGEKTGRLQRDHAVKIFADKMMGGKIGDYFLPLKIKSDFVILGNNSGQKLIAKTMSNGEIRLKEKEWLASRVSYAIKSIHDAEPFVTLLKIIADFTFSQKQVDAIVQTILTDYEYVRFDDVASVKFKSEHGMTWRKLDFDPNLDAGAPTPTWDAFAGRILSESSRLALGAFIGSLFDPDITLQQYCWLVGEGRDGKGSLFRFLNKIFGNAATAFQTDPKDVDRYWSATFLGKRLGIASDVRNPDIIHQATFLQVTGGDAVSMRQMRKVATMEKLNCQLMLGSNVKPTITWEKAIRRRAIYIEFEERTAAEIPNFEKLLWSERAAIVGKCMMSWDPYRCEEKIPVDPAIFDALAEENTSDWQNIAGDYLSFAPGLKIRTDLLWDFLESHIKGISHNDSIKKKFSGFLRNKYGVARSREKERGRPAYFLTGVAIDQRSRL